MQLRMLHLTDIHCATNNLKRALSREEYDFVVCSGDFECVDTAEVFVEEAGEAVAVTGNMDSESIRDVLKRAGILIDGAVRECKGLRFAGVGGLTPWIDIQRLKESNSVADVLVSHHPPYGHLDESLFGGHGGLKELLELYNVLRPRLHLFGHIHEARGYEEVSGITLVNAGPLAQGYYALITIEGEGRITVSLRRL
jgi:Icc-related predicted phosphoesterase